VPLPPSTVISMPSFNVVVAFLVPTTAGQPSSRLTIAAWQAMPPSSVTMAPARFIPGTISGMVILVTMMSPCLTLSRSLPLDMRRTNPVATPGAAPRPVRSTFPLASEDEASAFLALPMVVMGRDWRM